MNYHKPVLKLNQPDDNYKIRPLPQPTGKYPYHLNITDVIRPAHTDSMSFYMLGDTGGLGRPEARGNLVAMMAAQQPAGEFIYHLGDLVYHYGEATQYPEQFFKPFDAFKGPVFAIAGNHDSDVNPDALPYQSLDAFVKVFCTRQPETVSFSGNAMRKSMVQPNVYWTLETPLATFIGLHTNVPKFGAVMPDQQAWFQQELINAPKDKLLILCMHHAPYSADTNHGSSLPMINMLNEVFTHTGVKPDIVFSGHVHNYQRFTRRYADGKQVPFIVAGAGGFEELHSITQTTDPRFIGLDTDEVTLDASNETQHGFLRIDISKKDGILTLNGEYFVVGAPDKPLDAFKISKAL